MQRVVILGCSGSGKSTFARALGARTGLPVVHLDAMFWRPKWTPPDPQVFRDAVAEVAARERWITDGIYAGRTFDLRLPRADTVIFLVQPRWLCLIRVIWRCLTDFGRGRPDMAEGCAENLDPEFLKWVWTFERVHRPNIEQKLADFGVTPIYLNGDVAMARFLETAQPLVGAAAGAAP
jgi:adenylate kinase family enzyme